MLTKLFKTRPERLGKYGRQWVGQNTRRFCGQKFSVTTRNMVSWARMPRKALPIIGK